jgi:hypothetical protein
VAAQAFTKLRLSNRPSRESRCTPNPRAPRNPQTHMQTQRKLQRAFHPSQRFNLALPFPFGPSLTLEPSRADPERLELLPNSYCRLLPGRPPFALAFACISLHSSLQNHLVLPTGAFSRFTHAKWNHSRGQSSLSHATILPYDTSLQ